MCCAQPSARQWAAASEADCHQGLGLDAAQPSAERSRDGPTRASLAAPREAAELGATRRGAAARPTTRTTDFIDSFLRELFKLLFLCNGHEHGRDERKTNEKPLSVAKEQRAPPRLD